MMERLPLQEQIDALREDMESQWEMTCSMFRNYESVIDLLARDSIETVSVMKDFSETQRGLVKYITSKKDTNKKRYSITKVGGGEGITSICNKDVTSDTSDDSRS